MGATGNRICFSDTGAARPGRAGRRWLLPAAVLASLSHGQARAQLIGRYFPANIPAYEDWFATVDTSGVGDQQVTGERVGSFIIQPTFTEGIGYDSDPSGRPSGAGSADLSSSGVVTVTSDWSRNALGAALTVNDVRYFSQPTFDYTTWTASAGGAIDYGDDEIRLGYIHVNSVTLPTDAGTFGLTAPITNQIDDFRVSDTIGPGPLTLVPAVVGDLYRFSAPPGELAGLEQGVSNRNVVTPSITANYQFAGGHNLVVVLSDEYGTYPGGNTGGFTPNYNDVSLLAGIEYRQSALFAYRALVGYEERFLQGNGHAGGTISAPAAELDAIWRRPPPGRA
jgi:hypothetical protein